MTILKLSTALWLILNYSIVDFSNLMELPIGHPRHQKTWDLLVKGDYIQLLDFSFPQNLYDLTESDFEELLWSGLIQAIAFYESPTDLNPAMVNTWINNSLAINSNLGHVLPKPQIINGNKHSAFKALNNFTGVWHGHWKSHKVHHNWLPVRDHNREIIKGTNLLGFQSCFTGDGVGWNYVIEKEGEIVILGFVYHFKNNGSIVSGDPHYAFLNNNNQLTWVTNNHIYYEFTCNQENCTNSKHYVITGASYEHKQMKSKLVSGFQAVYLGEEQVPPTYITLTLHDVQEGKNQFLKNLKQSVLKVFQSTNSIFETGKKIALNNIRKSTSLILKFFNF